MDASISSDAGGGIRGSCVSGPTGHQSMKITERHCAPWVHARQAQDVKRAWADDPIFIAETKGTPEVHQNTQSPN